MKPVKLILEGANLSGKTSVFEELEEKFPDCFALTLHGYFRPELKNQFKSDKDLADYFKKRLLSFVGIFQDFKTEEVLFNRVHLTDIVHCRIFLGINQDYKDLEKKLNKLKVGLVLLEADDRAIKKRLKEREKVSKAGPWDREFESIIKKREAYQKAFEQSQIKRKVIIDTSKTTAEEAARKILHWWGDY